MARQSPVDKDREILGVQLSGVRQIGKIDKKAV